MGKLEASYGLPARFPYWRKISCLSLSQLEGFPPKDAGRPCVDECLGMHVRASVSSREAGVRVGGQRVCVDSY